MAPLPILYTSHPTSNGKQESIFNYMSGTFWMNFLTFTKNSIFKCLYLIKKTYVNKRNYEL